MSSTGASSRTAKIEGTTRHTQESFRLASGAFAERQPFSFSLSFWPTD
jgi:hypothetical protein